MTGSTGTVTAMLGDASAITIKPSSVFVVQRSRVSATGVSLRRGSISVKSSPYRWPNEALQVSTPVTTTGVRGTEFDVNVISTGEALIYVETGVVTAAQAEIPAGSAASLVVDEPAHVTSGVDPAAALERFTTDREAAYKSDRRKIAEAMIALMRRSIERRRNAVKEIIETVKEIQREARDDASDRSDHIGRMAGAVTRMRRGLDRAREILSNDRESGMQEEILREIFADPQLPLFGRLAIKAALDFAEKDRSRREDDRRKLDDASEKLGGALSNLAQEAFARPGQGKTAARILREGLGLPLDAVPSSERITIDRAALGWEPGKSWTLMRTIRGREDARTPVAVTLEGSAGRLVFSKTPEAFDTAQQMEISISDTGVLVSQFPNVPQVNAAHPALLYRFPFCEGDSWVVWQPRGLFSGIRIERTVTATEEVNSFDCLRIETRLRIGRSPRAGLIHVEWVSPGIGQIREVSFKNEINSVYYEERIQ